MKRIYSIDFLKLLFAYLIAFSHININLPGAACAVVFFFIISGYFLSKKFYSKKQKNANNTYNGALYTIDHMKSLYPHYIFSLIVMFAYFCARNIYCAYMGYASAIPFTSMLSKIYSMLPEIFMVQNIGFYDGGMNYPLWQVCALLICGYFIYTLLCYNEKLSINIIFPLAIILIQVFLTNNSFDPFGTVSMWYIPLLRAFSAISYGVLLYRFLQSEYYIKNISKHKTVLNICSVIALICLFVFKDNNILLITSAFIVASFGDPSSWFNVIFNRKIFRCFGEFSYAIYLNHALVIWFVNDFKEGIFDVLNMDESTWKVGLLFFVLLTAYSILTTFFIRMLKRKFQHKS